MLIEFILIIGLYWDYKHLLDLYFMELYICGLVFYRTVKACSHRAKVNAKAKKIKEQSEEIKKITGKHQRKFSLSLGVGRP